MAVIYYKVLWNFEIVSLIELLNIVIANGCSAYCEVSKLCLDMCLKQHAMLDAALSVKI